VTLRYILEGAGGFDALPSPTLAPTEGLTTYPGTNSFVAADALGLSGVKTFEQVVILESPSVTALRFQPYSFLDPETGRYTTARLNPIPVLVRGGEVRPVPAVAGTTTTNAAPLPATSSDGLPPMAGRAGARVSLGAPWAGSPWFAALIFAPLLAIGAMGGVRRWRFRRAEANRPTRAGLARLSVRERQAAMHEAEAAGRSPQFFAALDALLRGQAALSAGLPGGAAVTADVVDSRLVPRGLGAEEAERLRRLFAAVDAARFAPVAQPGELATWRAMADEAIRDLRALEEAGK
jgi:hypothetical protein